MLFIPKKVKKHQLGGEMTPAEPPVAPEEAPVEEAPVEGGQDPIMMLAEAAAQALLGLDCLIAMQVCLGLVGLVLQMAAPLEALGEPVFRKGGVLLRRIKR